MRRFVEDDEDEDFTIEGARAERETDIALLVVYEQGKRTVERWFPKSQITDDSEVWEVGHRGKLVISGWFARKEGLS